MALPRIRVIQVQCHRLAVCLSMCLYSNDNFSNDIPIFYEFWNIDKHRVNCSCPSLHLNDEVNLLHVDGQEKRWWCVQHFWHTTAVAAWLTGSAMVSINEITLRRARLVLGRVTVCGRVNHLRLWPATQANSAFYPKRDGKWVLAKGRWRSAAGSKGRYGSFHLWINVWVEGKTVWSLVNRCHTRALQRWVSHDKGLHKLRLLHFFCIGLYIWWRWPNFFISYLCHLFSRHFVGQTLLNICHCDVTLTVR